MSIAANGPKLNRNRRIERAGVLAVQAFFEANDCVVQIVNGENDFGKDLYIDITQDRMVTGLTVAAQVKSGRSYRTATGYSIPVENHYRCWRNSTVPVIGIVHDPDSGGLYWTNITGQLRQLPKAPSAISVDPAQKLTTEAIEHLASELASPIANTRDPDLPMLGRLWPRPELSEEAVWDCFALGRHDFRYLLALRATLAFAPESTIPSLLWVLGHVTSHPDIFWGEHNWVPPETRALVLPSFRWRADEIALFVRTAGHDWERGTLGQTVLLLLGEDPDAVCATLAAVRETYPRSVDDAWMIFCVYISLCGDGAGRQLDELLPEFPMFVHLPAYANVVEHVRTHGSLPIVE